MVEKLENIDQELFIFLNGLNSPFFDTVMHWVGHRFFWIPLYIFFIWLVAKNFGNKTWLILAFITLMIVISDQVSVHFFKNIFLRYRPCHNLEISHLVHTIDGHCGGKYGFVSSHAVNSFAMATFLVLLFRGKYKYFTFFIFLWASLIAYQRIYAGVHYPADALVGATIGMTIGFSVFKIYHYIAQYQKK